MSKATVKKATPLRATDAGIEIYCSAPECVTSGAWCGPKVVPVLCAWRDVGDSLGGTSFEA
jgi:hypothetical protein